MKTLLVILFICGTVCAQHAVKLSGVTWGTQGTQSRIVVHRNKMVTKKPDSTVTATSWYSSYVDSASIFQHVKSLTFGYDKHTFTFTWEKGVLEVVYGEDSTPSESVKRFFDFLKTYIKEEYYIIKKSEIDAMFYHK